MHKEKLSPGEQVAFDMYFASLASMQVHPGSGAKGHAPYTFEECRAMALEMLNLRREVI